MTLPRREPRANGDGGQAGLTGGELCTLFPCLAEFLCQSSWEEGVPRTTGTALVLVEDGRWKLWLHDRDVAESLWVSGATLDEVFSTADQLIASGAGEWRKDRPQSRGGGRHRS